ncbi:hypothetical protein [Phenylobacterium sp.]|uniref:hypothetical protein n=1 Tax=Phenylobacterium sp. TaxID=1871053 RepID=UPI0025DB78D0|nr:hypothetical protein [Phenylobacterium sp.]
MNRRVLIAALLASPLSACLKSADILVGGALPTPTFRFQQGGILKTSLAFPGELSIGDADAPREHDVMGPNPLWRVETRHPLDIRAIVYGQRSFGLSELRPAVPLRLGVVYVAVVSGGAYRGEVHFAGAAGRLVSAQDYDAVRAELAAALQT